MSRRARRGAIRLALGACLLANLAGCPGETGTLSVQIVTAPGSTLLDPVTRLRATLSSPLRVVEADRGPDGFELAIEVEADGRGAVLTVEALDAGGALVANGATPVLPIAAVEADIAIYLGAPDTLAAAPVALDPPRSEIGTGLLQYGTLLVGGRDAAGAPLADLDIYNAYTHTVQAGEDLPAARRGIAVGTSTSGYAYLFGGADAAGAPTGTAWRFDTQAEPAGDYLELDDDPAVARTGAVMAPLGVEEFVVSGEPVVFLSGFTGLAAVQMPMQLPPAAISVQDSTIPGSPIYTVFIGASAGSTGIVRLLSEVFTDEGAPADALRTGHGLVPTPDDEVIAIGGRTAADGLVRSAVRYAPQSRVATSIPDVLATAREDAAIATNGEVLVVAGGRDAAGAVLGDAELIELATLVPIATIPLLVPRAGAVARPLTNGQIAIYGGVDAAGMPVATIELFTPRFLGP
jgi:hypothetical protein